MLWLDAFTANVDRSWRNPNLLLWHGDLWVIDHGAALYFHHGWTRRRPRPGPVRRPALVTSATTCWPPTPAVCRPRRRTGATPDRRPTSTEALALVPDEWLEPVPAPRPGRRVRAAYVEFLHARFATRAWLPGVGAMTAGVPYQYVVLRCVPRVDREEFLNVGVVLYCQAADYLRAAWHVDRRPADGAEPRPRRRPGLRRPGLRRGRLRGRPPGCAPAVAPHQPALRVPQGPPEHRPAARPGARRHHRRPDAQLDRLLSTLVHDPGGVGRTGGPSRQNWRAESAELAGRGGAAVGVARIRRGRARPRPRRSGPGSRGPPRGGRPAGSETATAPASTASSAARSVSGPGVRNREATAMWRRPWARKARTASPVAGGALAAKAAVTGSLWWVPHRRASRATDWLASGSVEPAAASTSASSSRTREERSTSRSRSSSTSRKQVSRPRTTVARTCSPGWRAAAAAMAAATSSRCGRPRAAPAGRRRSRRGRP